MTRLRKEIWIRPEGGHRRLHRTTSARESGSADLLRDEEDLELSELSTVDLNRRFINTFLYLIGKLFTNINMETFQLALDALRKEFKALVWRSPLPIGSERLVQIMSLNMFVVEHTKMKSDSGVDSRKYRSALQDAALQLAFELFGILTARCNDLMKNRADDLVAVDLTSSSVFADDDLSNLLPPVKVWCDWLLGNNDTWDPVVRQEPFTQLATLATHLEKLKPALKPVQGQMLTEDELRRRPEQIKITYDLVKLPEDALLCGFDPWFRGLDWVVYRRFSPRSIPLTLAQEARRLDAINFCVEFLEGLEPPILKWSLPDNAHISLVEKPRTAKEKAMSSILAAEQDVLDESYSDDDDLADDLEGGVPVSGNAAKLKHLKGELERKRKADERESRRIRKQILADHVRTTLEVNPHHLIPDTNCFVDFLPEIRRLAECNTYQLKVPLIVLNELDGLAKGGGSGRKAAEVAENARKALNYLRERPHNVKCITSKGTILASLGVTTEEDGESGKKNDDLILDSCLSLTSSADSTTTAEESGIRKQHQGGIPHRLVRRDVVLLTEDRNLKLKAHIADVPVNKMSHFIQWAFDD